jgi:formylglycine-generating enzyme required for sulfatase activity
MDMNMSRSERTVMVWSRLLPAVAVLLCVLWPALPVSAQQSGAADDLAFWEELAFWEAIKDSDNPAEYQAYLEIYPDGRFAPLARVRLSALGVADAAPPDAIRRYRATANVNVRAEPSTSAARVGSLGENETVEVIDTVADGNWFRVRLADGVEGYIFAALLAPETTAGEPAPPEPPSAEDTFRDCPECPLMTLIPAGEFDMGSDRHRREEQPVHRVTIARPFALGVHEVTVAEWQACVDAGACRYRPDATDATLPVSGMSWDDAQEYVDWLSRHTGASYRLPSEAEWEYAASAGADTDYWWGNEPGNNRANCQGCGSRWDDREPAPVGSFAANPFGLYDVHGNLWEWVQDCWHGDYRGAPDDGSARSERLCISRVQRGGAYKLDPDYMRLTRRHNYDRDVRYFLHGLRVAKTLP